MFWSETGNHRVSCYPQIKLFDTGVLLVEFRVIGLDQDIDVAEFIRQHVNMFQLPFERVEVPPGIVAHASNAYYFGEKNDWPIHLRAGLAYLNRGHRRAVEQATTIHDDQDFSFELVDLSREEGPEGIHTLAGVFMAIASTTAYVLSSPREGIALAFLGQRPVIEWGGYWTGRPHVYLIRFDEQGEEARANESHHGDAFGRILARAATSSGSDWRRFLPDDGRPFQDFNVYVNEAMSMWVWSLAGIRQQEPWADNNRGHLIYEHQGVVEVLEYGYMVHRALYESASRLDTQKATIAGRRRLAKLKAQMDRPTGFGEIKELLHYGWTTYDLPGLRNRIDEVLEINHAEAAMVESQRTGRIGIALSVAFGMLAIPPLAADVVRPLWDLLGWWTPESVAGSQLYLVLITLLSTALILLLLIRFVIASREFK